MSPEPLQPGSLLAQRFAIVSVLGRGGFGIVYLAEDHQRGDQVVVKELAPEGSRRNEAGVVDLMSGSANPQILRQRFLDEARVMGRLNVKGILSVRASFAENGTAYFVTEHLIDSETLEARLLRERRMAIGVAITIFRGILAVLEPIHAAGILHRDIKPSNILLAPTKQPYLIDFGSAREFMLDSAQTHTVMYTPGYAPPEQLSERARRGPATDIFALGATLYQMLAGIPPNDVADRMAGQELVALEHLRPEIDANIATLVHRCLALNYAERPQSAAEVLSLLDGPPHDDEAVTVADLDDLLDRCLHFKYQKYGCPNCHEPMVQASPLKKGACPVCRHGHVRLRKIHDGLCPICKAGLVSEVDNAARLAICPQCAVGTLTRKKKSLLAKTESAHCPSCSADWEIVGNSASHDGQTQSVADWVGASGRTPRVAICAGCHANFDVLPDGRWKLRHPTGKRKLDTLFPEEWARVASGLDPGIGNAECDACSADFFVDTDLVTLLYASEDPHRFAAEYMGRALSPEAVRWLGVGKESPSPGLVCEDCGTELDMDGSFLRLVRSPNRTLGEYAGSPKKMEDWHRIGLHLPEIEEEPAIRERLETAIAEAYPRGEVGFDSPEIAWKGDATRLSDGATSTLLIDASELIFGGILRKWRVPRDSVVDASAEGDELCLQISGEREPILFEIRPRTLYVALKTGQQEIVLDASHLAERLRRGC